MKKLLLNMSVVITAAMIFFASCWKGNEAKVIPRSQLADIYAELLLTDQWIIDTPGIRNIADTSLVYAPILEKYGYTVVDYLYTVDKYMDDPERFSRIFRTSGEILQDRLDGLEKEKADLLAHEARMKLISEIVEELQSEIDFGEYFPYLADESYVHYYDSLSCEPDSLRMIYRMVSVERADTVYDRLRMIVTTDSLKVTSDTVQFKNDTVPQGMEMSQGWNLFKEESDGSK